MVVNLAPRTQPKEKKKAKFGGLNKNLSDNTYSVFVKRTLVINSDSGREKSCKMEQWVGKNV